MIRSLHAHWVATNHLLRYLHGIINLGLRYIVGDVSLHGTLMLTRMEMLLTGRVHLDVVVSLNLP